MIVDENDLLLAFVHDPPDKALDIKGHVSRACDLATAAWGVAGTVTFKDNPATDLHKAEFHRLTSHFVLL